MRLVNIAFVKVGDFLARTLYSTSGRLLLSAGSRLTNNYISKIREHGFDAVYIMDENFSDVRFSESISAKTRNHTIKFLMEIDRQVQFADSMHVDLRNVKSTTQLIIDEVLSNFDLMGNAVEMHNYDEYTYNHSINSTIIALILAVGKGWSNDTLLELGMGVLMHDLGKIKIPSEVLNKVGKLTALEFEEIKKHSANGFEILRRNPDMSLLSAHVAYQHHEKWDGTGYPRGLKGLEIHEYGRISAVADVYEALTSKRIYRNALQPYEAYEYIIASAGSQFELDLVAPFSRLISPYPIGQGVRLSNGQRGNVIRQNASFPTRPYVRMTHEQENPLAIPVEYNLVDHPSLVITGIENK